MLGETPLLVSARLPHVSGLDWLWRMLDSLIVDGWGDWGLSPCVPPAGWLRHALLKIAEYQRWKQKMCKCFHKFLLALFATVSLVKASDMAKLRVSVWGHFQRHEMWRLLIRAINVAILQYHGKIELDLYRNCQILTSFRILMAFR